MTAAFLLAIAWAVLAGIALRVTYEARRHLREATQFASDATERYAEAITIVVLIAKHDPPVAAADVIAACNALLKKHRVTVEYDDRRTVH